jgi:MFS superfamily sulfate permease-like transporter
MGGSSFKGAVGSMMIEVMPFLHLISNTIETKMEGDPNPKAILASIMAAYALSCILTGLVFLTLGVFKLGDLIQFFPRHILVGCIGGIGVFLMTTGIEITSGIKPAFSMDVLTELFAPRQLKLWSSAIAVSLFLKILQYLAHHPLLIPLFYLLVPLIFYAIVIFIRIPMDELREEGWLFNITPKHGDAAVPFWEFWTYYDFTLVNWNAVFGNLCLNA